MAESETHLSGSRERKLVLLLCCLAAIHVFIFSAAFPVFNNMDEQPHFDLVLKYAHGHVPRELEPLGEESSQYALVYGSAEYRWPPEFFTNGDYPTPPWIHPTNSLSAWRADAFQKASESWQTLKDKPMWVNYESSQQPLYYTMAGAWWDAGRLLGFEGLRAVYWLRFLNVLFVAMLIWIGYYAARLIFPENPFIRLGVPALIAFIPQQAFYSIQNDVLSPVCFGLAFIGLIKFVRAETPGVRLGCLTGLALAATFLTKLSNAPLLAVSAMVVLLKMFQLKKNGKLRASVPALTVMFLVAALPVAAWLAWCKYNFGDLTGTAAKIEFMTWTRKPFAEWWHHPIFSLPGFWTFLSGLLVAFWQGEFRWHGSPLDLPVPDAIYVIMTLAFFILALMRLRRADRTQRHVLLFSLALLISGMTFLAYLSISYNFGLCPSPSQEFPYFIAGRLLLGALIPFLLLFLYGLNSLLADVKNRWTRPFFLAAIILFLLVSEIITDWMVFQSQYNWYHL